MPSGRPAGWAATCQEGCGEGARVNTARRLLSRWAQDTADTGHTGAWPAGKEGSAGSWTCHGWAGRRFQHCRAGPHFLRIQSYLLQGPTWQHLAFTHTPMSVLPQGLCLDHFLCQVPRLSVCPSARLDPHGIAREASPHPQLKTPDHVSLTASARPPPHTGELRL